VPAHAGDTEEGMEQQIKLGSKVKDKITGFTGTATARAEYLERPPQVFVEAEATEGGRRAADAWITESRLEVVG
jgi:hypothetical protein